MAKSGADGGNRRPESMQRFRYWVEVTERSTGAIKRLPLHEMARISLSAKKSEPEKPGERYLRLEDGASSLEAGTFEDLVIKLRALYPDDSHVRTLHHERDLRAEQAFDELVRALARAAADKAMSDAALNPDPSRE